MTDVVTSIRARLQNAARQKGLPFDRVLSQYANERILYRLGESEQRDRFVLKGATLFTLWGGAPHRSTKDLDLLSEEAASEQWLRAAFVSLLERPSNPPDGLVFDTAGLIVGPIREDKKHGGIRLSTTAFLDRARIPVQVDVGFGDAAEPEWGTMPSLLDLPPARVRAYSRYAVVAEKVEAMVQLQQLNSRMKDFFDVDFLAQNFDFLGVALANSLRATFERRGTPFPADGGSSLWAGLRKAPEKPQQWAGFVRKAAAGTTLSFDETLSRVQAFVQEPLVAAASDVRFNRSWSRSGSWR